MTPDCGVARGFRDESVPIGDDLDTGPMTAILQPVFHSVVFYNA